MGDTFCDGCAGALLSCGPTSRPRIEVWARLQRTCSSCLRWRAHNGGFGQWSADQSFGIACGVRSGPCHWLQCAVQSLQPPMRKSRDWRPTSQHQKMHSRQRSPRSRAARPVRNGVRAISKARRHRPKLSPWRSIQSLSSSTSDLMSAPGVTAWIEQIVMRSRRFTPNLAGPLCGWLTGTCRAAPGR